MTSTSTANQPESRFTQDFTSPLISGLLQRNSYETISHLSLDQQSLPMSLESQLTQRLLQHQQQQQLMNNLHHTQQTSALPLTPVGPSSMRSNLDKSKITNQSADMRLSAHSYFSPLLDNTNNHNDNLAHLSHPTQSHLRNFTPLMLSPDAPLLSTQRGGAMLGGYSFDDVFDVNPNYFNVTSQRNTPLLQLTSSPHIQTLMRNNVFNQSSIPQLQQQSLLSSSNQQQQQQQTGVEQSPQISYDFYNNTYANDLFDDMGLQDWMGLGGNDLQSASGVATASAHATNSTAGKSSVKHEEAEEDEEEFNLAESYPLQKKLKTDRSYTNFNDANSDDRDATTTAFSSSSSCSNDQRTMTMSRYGNCSTSRPTKDKYASRLLNSGEKTLKHGFFISPESSQNMCQATLTAPIRSKMLFSECPTPQKPSMKTASTIKQEQLEEVEEFSVLSVPKVQLSLNRSSTTTSIKSRAIEEDEKTTGAGGRNGLRILSKKVREIVCDLKETTYKQVAESLIKDMETKKNQGSLEFAKDEQNVKRRVYDALNVLIAANVLSKEGKKVKAEPSAAAAMKQNAPSSQNPLQKREYLMKALISKQERLEKKQSIIDDLLLKFVSLKSLCHRNATNEALALSKPLSAQTTTTSSLKCLTLQNQQKTKTFRDEQDQSNDENQKRKLRFPFIGVYSPSNNSRISFKKFSHGLLVSSVQQLNIQGDIDILVKLFSSRQNALYLHQAEKRKFLSPALLQFLSEMDYYLQRGSQFNEAVHHNDEDEEDDDLPNTLQMEVTITNNKIIERKHLPSQSQASTQSLQRSPTLAAAERFYAHHAGSLATVHQNSYRNNHHQQQLHHHNHHSNELSLFNEFENDFLN